MPHEPHLLLKFPEWIWSWKPRSLGNRAGPHIYYMTFNAWLLKRQLPDADRITMLIRQAGPTGIAEGELRSAVDLSKELVDDLLAALVSARQVAVVERGGKRIYISRC